MGVATGDLLRAEVVGPPQIHTRGWAHAPETGTFLEDARALVTEALEKMLVEENHDPESLNRVARKAVGKLIGERTRQRPMIVPVIVSV